MKKFRKNTNESGISSGQQRVFEKKKMQRPPAAAGKGRGGKKGDDFSGAFS